MKTKIVIFIAIAVILTVVVFILTPREWQANLVSPIANTLKITQKSKAEPSASPNINAPEEFKFDATADLKGELEKVNPQVLDSDFK